MKLFPRIFIPFIGLCFVGCSLLPSEMKTAEKLMETSPDSALTLLKQVQPDKLLTNSDQALYGLLLFQALDKNKQALQPDSVINYSINYYEKKNNKERLASCYFYKGRMYNNAQKFDDATILYLKALDNLKDSKNYYLLGRVYSDMGYICFLQKDYIESRKKYSLSVDFFLLDKKTVEASFRLLDIGRTFYATKNHNIANQYFYKALNQTNDSLLCGSAYKEIGINFKLKKQYDSAQIYLRKSLTYKLNKYDHAIECFSLSDIFFNIEKYDSAFLYATIALKHPSNFYTQRECYRILANTAFMKRNYEQMAGFMTQFQSITDSVRRMESQTKTTVLEGIHKTTEVASNRKKYLTILGWLLPIIIAFSLLIVYRLRSRNKDKELELEGKEHELEVVGQQLSQKQMMLRANLIQKIEEAKIAQTSVYKKASFAQREEMDKALYNNCLHLDDWNKFSTIMNQAFDNLLLKLEQKHPEITHKELIWCCLYLLDVPTPEILLLLDYKQDSLYKLKQRLVQKMKLKSSKELDNLLEAMITQ